MVGLSTWFRYIANKFEYSVSVARVSYLRGQIAEAEVLDTIWRNLLHGKLTFLHWNKGEEMDPTIGTQGGTLLVRKIPAADPINATAAHSVNAQKVSDLDISIEASRKEFLEFGLLKPGRRVHVGDVVVLKDPINTANILVRRLAAIEGYEMASKDVNDEPFVLEKDQCWVLADNTNLKPKEAYDSRTFGPVTMADIVGRAIYCLRNAVDHGPVKNSHFSTRQDSPVLEVELDVDEMAKNHKA